MRRLSCWERLLRMKISTCAIGAARSSLGWPRFFVSPTAIGFFCSSNCKLAQLQISREAFSRVVYFSRLPLLCRLQDTTLSRQPAPRQSGPMTAQLHLQGCNSSLQQLRGSRLLPPSSRRRAASLLAQAAKQQPRHVFIDDKGTGQFLEWAKSQGGWKGEFEQHWPGSLPASQHAD